MKLNFLIQSLYSLSVIFSFPIYPFDSHAYHDIHTYFGNTISSSPVLDTFGLLTPVASAPSEVFSRKYYYDFLILRPSHPGRPTFFFLFIPLFWHFVFEFL